MKLNNHMEVKNSTTNFLHPLTKLKTEKDQGTIKLLVKNFVKPPEIRTMAIKENKSIHNKYVYSVPSKFSTLSYMSNRTKTMQDAKIAFLNTTVNSISTLTRSKQNLHQNDNSLYYAQIAITSENEDTRSTGGGKDVKIDNDTAKENHVDDIRKKMEHQHGRVSFKIKNASSHRRPPLATKTMTITSNKVSELTKKFNSLVQESNGTIKPSKLVKTIEHLQTVSQRSASNSSTPSSTLSASPNIKIVLRHRRGSKKRPSRMRCSSVDSIDKIKSESAEKIRVNRSKSDGTKKPKTPKKRLKYQDSSDPKSGSDSVDGVESTQKETLSIIHHSNAVKNTIKKFECEITAHTNTLSTKKTVICDKPKVPEKKVSLTKNVVVKDGVPKIRTIKPINESPKINNLDANTSEDVITSKKETIYDKKKYKTNYIHTDKLALHIVDIIHDDINEVTPTVIPDACFSDILVEEENAHQDISSRITPNESFLWRRKSSTQIYSESEKSSDGPYSLLNITTASLTESNVDDDNVFENSQCNESHISDNKEKVQENLDFESNLVEAYNKEIMVCFTSKPKKEETVEDDYEPLEPIGDITLAPITNIVEKLSLKMNCPLPEIPKKSNNESLISNSKENIYQCLLEARSHPEGDENSLHNYELCENGLEERTRGDGDSDDGYEYCKSPIKPYCHMSSSGIQIVEQQPSHLNINDKNYEITKSVSGTSTVSYEKIGSERNYEKIPRPYKPKDISPPSYNNRHSFVSSEYNDGENIYDTIKHADGVSLSHCYESIPNSPSLVKFRNNFKRQLSSAVQKRLSFDQESNISHSTISSEQKTNSIYGQRSILSYNGQEITFPVPNSETSDRSDRSDDWVDVSDEEKSSEQQIIIVRERSRGRKSPLSWSQKVRDQWHNSPRQNDGDNNDSSNHHLYESLEPPPIDEDFDSFDSDTDTDEPFNTPELPKPTYAQPVSRLAELPEPPEGGGGANTLTKIASVAQRKMRELTRNLTKKRYSGAMDKMIYKQPETNGQDKPKSTSSMYSIYDKLTPNKSHVYGNISHPEQRSATNIPNKGDMTLIKNGYKDEFKTTSDKRLSNGDIPPPLPEKLPKEKPTTPTTEQKQKDSGTLSRKAYFSFKSRFRRSIAADGDVPSALKTNSTFYLTDSMDGDSGFSNCSDNAHTSGSAETLQYSPAPAQGTLRRRRDGTRMRAAWSESSPCLTPLERPAVPPPPPPPPALRPTDLSAVNEELKRLLPTLSRKEKSPRTRTSWYAECGADDAPAHSPRPYTTSWYAEAGLYQASNISSSSGASSGSHPASPLPHSLFTHEPLYQFYNAAKIQSACRETGDSDSDQYEAGGGGSGGSVCSGEGARPSAMALVAPARGPARTLWCEVPEVINSTVLSSLAPMQKRLQEAKFELVTSEASYLNSLHVLEAHFIGHPAFRDPELLTRTDRDLLFATIQPVRKCSQLLMNELEKCWQENILLEGLCDIVRRHAEEHFHVYVKYCENQTLMMKALQRLRENTTFAITLRKLESHPACQSLSLHSFLLLPMQRITRLPLLMDAVLKNLNRADAEHQSCMDALATLNSFVSQCNEGARNTERIEEMVRLAHIIEFPPNARDPPSLGPACTRRDRRPVRWLVRSGEMTQIVWKAEDQLKLTFGKKFQKIHLYLFLFNDLLVITKKRSEEWYVAVDWCARSMVDVCCGEDNVAGAKHSLLLTLLENHNAKTVEMVMSCPSATDASRWSEALAVSGGAAGGAGGLEGGEAVYEGWDCPQVTALYAYTPAQPDELTLNEGDIVNVTRKTNEGWYYGERIRDGETGWFPGSYTMEIASAHVRARNLRQRYRLLALSATYYGPKKRQP